MRPFESMPIEPTPCVSERNTETRSVASSLLIRLRLLLCEEQSAIGGAHESVGVISALPRDAPRRAGRDDARDGRDCYIPRA